MRKFLTLTLAVLFSLCALTFLWGCNKEEPPKEPSFQAELEDFDLPFGSTKQLMATGKNLVWESDNQQVATVNDGLVTAISLGSAKISVSSGNKKEECTVTVVASTVAPTLELDVAPRSLRIGGQLTLSPIVKFDGQAVQTQITFDSANDQVVTVTDQGVVTAEGLGQTTVSVSYSYAGHSDTVEITFNVIEDVVLEVNKNQVNLVVRTASGDNLTEDTVTVTKLTKDDQAKPIEEVEWSVLDDTIATVKNGVITAKKFGQTTVSVKYTTANGTEAKVNIAVTVGRETLETNGTGYIDLNWDFGQTEAKDFAYVELPEGLYLDESEVLEVLDATGKVVSNDGLKISKAKLKSNEETFLLGTSDFIYQVNVIVEKTYIEVTELEDQFDSPIGNGVELVNGFEGKQKVVKTTSKAGAEGIWSNANGHFRLSKYPRTWQTGYLIFDLYVEAGTKMGGYLYVWSGNDILGTSMLYLKQQQDESYTIECSLGLTQIVDANFDQAPFTFSAWNTIVIDTTSYSDENVTEIYFMPSFDTLADEETQTAYYADFRFASAKVFEKMLNGAESVKYTVKFDAKDDGVVIPDQKLGFREKVQAPEMTAQDFIGWAIDGELVDLSKLYVTKDITLEAVYNRAYSYKVQHYVRKTNGTYELKETESGLSANMGSTVTATPKTYSGYTYNPTLSAQTISGEIKNDNLVLACYYENDAYTFKTADIRHNGFDTHTVQKSAMQSVSVAHLQGNTWHYLSSVADASFMSMKLTEENIGKYLLLNVYTVSSSSYGYVNYGFGLWGNVPTTDSDMPDVKNQCLVGYFDANGKYLVNPSPVGITGQWTTIVIYLDSEYFSDELSDGYFNFDIALFDVKECYIGEVAFLEEDAFEEFFETRSTATQIEGVTRYGVADFVPNVATSSANLAPVGPYAVYVGNANAAWLNNVQIKGVESYTAGQYVVLKTMFNDVIAIPSLYDNATALIPAIYYTMDNERVDNTSLALGTWYNVVFKVDVGITVGAYAGTFIFENVSAGQSLAISDIMVMTETAYKTYFNIQEDVVQDVVSYKGSQLSLASTATGNCTLQTSGDSLIYTAKSGMPWDRTLKIDGVFEYKAGQYVVFRMKFTGGVYHYFYGAGTAIAYYDDNKQSVQAPSLDTWVTVVFKITTDTQISATSGALSILDVVDNYVEISNAYIMTENGYNTFFNLNS